MMTKFLKLKITVLAVVILSVFSVNQVSSQNLDVPYVPTPYEVVEKMLDVTNVGPGDYVIDLGSGDGRIVIAAAERGAFGHGIDLNPVRIREAEENARKAGVSDKVIFVEGNLFDADISRATVITMYLLSSVNLQLRPTLLEQLRPGTRIVSHSFSMGEWEADEHLQVNNRHVYYWVIPADLKGRWEWRSGGQNFVMEVEQEFQKVSIELNLGNRRLQVNDPLLAGERISFTAFDPRSNTRYLFSGRIEGISLTGTMQVRAGNSRSIEDWSATLRAR